MKILAFLQNQWVKDPQRVREMYARHPEMREELTKRLLFAGSFTGHRLQELLGAELCRQIIWEESSPEIGGEASSKFPADLEHIYNAIQKHEPDLVVAFGGIAAQGCFEAMVETNSRKPVASSGARITFELITAPHPAARGGDAQLRLRTVAEEVKARINNERSPGCGTPRSEETCVKQ